MWWGERGTQTRSQSMFYWGHIGRRRRSWGHSLLLLLNDGVEHVHEKGQEGRDLLLHECTQFLPTLGRDEIRGGAAKFLRHGHDEGEA